MHFQGSLGSGILPCVHSGRSPQFVPMFFPKHFPAHSFLNYSCFLINGGGKCIRFAASQCNRAQTTDSWTMDAGTNEDFELLQSLPQDEASAAASPPAQTQLSKVTQGPFSKSRWRKRSSRACKTCNMRKVRCNVMAHGVPCSNCSHDEIECIVSFTNKK